MFLIALILTTGSISSAEVITLKNGKTINGKVLVKTADYIKVDIGLDMPVTYYFDDIENIASEINEKGLLEKVVAEDVEELKVEKDIIRDKKPLSERFMPKVSEEYILMRKALSEGQPSNAENSAVNESVKSDIKPLSFKDAREAGYQIRNLLLSFVDKYSDYLKNKNIGFKKEHLKPLFIYFVICYFLFSFPLYLIAQRLRLKNWVYLAWVPVLQFALMVRMADKSMFWFVLLFLPILNIFVFVAIWIRIVQYLQKSSLLGLLMMIPIVNIIVIYYLALEKEKQATPKLDTKK